MLQCQAMFESAAMKPMTAFAGALFLFSVHLSMGVFAAQSQYSKPASRDYPNQLLWGDTHVHTNLSIDANGMGNKSLSPDDAYRFAKGEPVQAYNGLIAQLSRPLDFLVIADHAENLGVMASLEKGHEGLEKTAIGEYWREQILNKPFYTARALRPGDYEHYREIKQSLFDFTENGRGFFWNGYQVGPVGDEFFQKSMWQEVITNAERHNDPGRFTALIGYEWTSAGGGTGYGDVDPQFLGNLHRVVIYRDGAEKTGQVLPFSALDSKSPEALWNYLQEYEELTGGEVLAIPHNGNISSGEMFALTDFAGKALTKQYADMRSRWEPLYEVTQIKGDGEAHPLLSPEDEFADYETWNSWGGKSLQYVKPEGRERRLASEYARSALKLGLVQKAALGVNPFKFGMIGSTDAHTSFATADESNFWGKLSLDEPSPYRTICCDDIGQQSGSEFAASGYAAVWAQENTRQAIFDAMKRREVYATTGPRIAVRFFGGWSFEGQDAYRPNLAEVGYDKGVPMGSDLPPMPKGEAPSFLVRALRDPEGANLDRVQLVKGWRSSDGELHEKVYNLALSDGRQDQGSKTHPVGNSADAKQATYLNTIGDPELAVVWRDPDFDPGELAYYYVRVLEIPTPRWNAYDTEFFDIQGAGESVLQTQQDRAYTSPIWYSPTEERL